MKEVKYSVVLCNRKYDELQIHEWLYSGIKVIWFGSKNEVERLKKHYKQFAMAYLLQAYDIGEYKGQVTIIDGKFDEEKRKIFNDIIKIVPHFNSEQYIVEHYCSDKNLIVEAGAGTGKTTVMVDRIMFLLHTVEDLSLADIAMITFTNEATQNMRHKVQKMLIKRFELTGNTKYITYLENECQMRTHTIHSFSKRLISELGANIGYSTDLKLRSYTYEREQIIRDVLDSLMKKHSQERVDEALGMKIHELVKLILNFWNKIENLGLSGEEISQLDWGKENNYESEALHHTLMQVFEHAEAQYNELKIEQNAISMHDIIRELRKILECNNELVLKSKPIRYLFVDEFQDSDNVQIQTIAWLERELGLKIFVVGDIKQSIYRFRGANDTAFETLRKRLENQGSNLPKTFALTKNYRTSEEILDKLDAYFRKWKERELLIYDNKLIAQNKNQGEFTPIPMAYRGKGNSKLNQKIVSTIKQGLKESIDFAEKNGLQDEPSQKVAVLTRTNAELYKIAELCTKNMITCYVKKEGEFYKSRAVREFLDMISAYLFSNEPTYRFNYLISSYGKANIDLEKVEEFGGKLDQINAYFDEVSLNDSWENYLKEFRLKPTLGVIMKIVKDKKPVNGFIAIRKKELETEGWINELIEEQVHIEALQYEENLWKLLQILREHFNGEFTSLYHIYKFLSLQVRTNREEDEPDVSEELGYKCVHCMTVHRSKGLEFDTVIIPYTSREYRQESMTEILIDEREQPFKVGWSYVVKNSKYEVLEEYQNNYYDDCQDKEIKDVSREEARLLYVALTRAIRSLKCIVLGDSEYCWANLLEGIAHE